MGVRTSESLANLAKALSAAQGVIEDAVADSVNPHFKSTYADLASVRAAIRKPLASNGLSVVQFPTTIDGKPALTTRLMHASGEWMESDSVLLVERPTMQGLGSALTYMRRYALAAVTGLAQQDDDGNEATKHPVTQAPRAPQPSGNPNVEGRRGDPTRKVTEPQLKRMHAIAKSKGWEPAAVKKIMADRFNVIVSSELTMGAYDDLCAILEAGPHAEPEMPEADPGFVPFDNQF